MALITFGYKTRGLGWNSIALTKFGILLEENGHARDWKLLEAKGFYKIETQVFSNSLDSRSTMSAALWQSRRDPASLF